MDERGSGRICSYKPDEEGGWKAKADYSVIEATNWYSYTSNNPVKYVDPTGMYDEEDFDAGLPKDSVPDGGDDKDHDAEEMKIYNPPLPTFSP